MTPTRRHVLALLAATLLAPPLAPTASGAPADRRTDLPAGVELRLLPHPDDHRRQVELYLAVPAARKHPGRRPVLLFVHGHQFGDRPGARRYVDRGLLRRHAKRGTLAAAVSQPGYGASDGPPDFCGPASHQAVHAAITALRQHPRVDPERIVLYGYSRGAITSSMVATEDDRLAGAILGAGEFDLVDAYARLDASAGRVQAGIKRNIEKESGATPEALRRRSALHAPRPIRVPTLILHGEDDDRVSLANARALARRLHEAGTPVRLHVYRGVGHGIPRRLRQGPVEDFLARVLAPAAEP